jgi:O-antigen/teichoic acid export membrane protein
MVSISDMGIYVVGAQIGSVIGLLEGAFNQAWVPWLFSQLKKNDPLIKFNIIKITYVYFVIIIVAALVLSWIAPWFISIIVGEKFRDASRYVIWIALGWAFDGMYKMVTNYIFYEQKTHLLAFITLLTGVANIVMCYFLIKYNGTIGAAQATMFSFLFSFILTWLLSMKVYKMPWNLKLPAHASC